MKSVASVRIMENSFTIDVTNAEVIRLDRCIYAFVVGDEILRIGSSKAPLERRMASWMRDVTRALNGLPSSTPEKEAKAWAKYLADGAVGEVLARRGTMVQTPIGDFPAYMDEESLLIGKYQPKLNWNKHR